MWHHVQTSRKGELIMYHYQIRQGSEQRAVQDWIVDQNGGPKKYFDANPCIKKWWHESDQKQKPLPDAQLELWKYTK
jgi:hypothetical protein